MSSSIFRSGAHKGALFHVRDIIVIWSTVVATRPSVAAQVAIVSPKDGRARPAELRKLHDLLETVVSSEERNAAPTP